jgi:hypothetical protein
MTRIFLGGAVALMLKAACAFGAAQQMGPFPVPAWVLECTRPAFVDANTDAQVQALKPAGVQAVFNAGEFKGLMFYDGVAVRDLWEVARARGKTVTSQSNVP